MSDLSTLALVIAAENVYKTNFTEKIAADEEAKRARTKEQNDKVTAAKGMRRCLSAVKKLPRNANG